MKKILTTSLVVTGVIAVLSCCNPEKFMEKMFEGLLQGLIQGILGEDDIKDLDIDIYLDPDEAEFPSDFPPKFHYPESEPFASFQAKTDNGTFNGLFFNLKGPCEDAIKYYLDLSNWQTELSLDTMIVEATDSTPVGEKIIAQLDMTKGNHWAGVHIEQVESTSGSVVIIYGEDINGNE